MLATYFPFSTSYMTLENNNCTDIQQQQQQHGNNVTITFVENKEQQQQQQRRLKEKPLSRISTGQSSADEVKSIRSILMRKMNLVKRKQRLSDRQEGPPYHTMDLDTVSTLLKTDILNGLKDDQVEAKRSDVGFNELEGSGGINPFKLFLKQFLNLMVMILLIATVSIESNHIILYQLKEITYPMYRLFPLCIKIG